MTDVRAKYLAWGATIFVAAAVIGAFFVIGSPAHERLKKFDERRIEDLQSVHYQVADYFAAQGSLPVSLDELHARQGFIPPLDPQTGATYEYTVQGPLQFRLCAIFSLASDQEESSSPVLPQYSPEAVDSWRHGAGRGCFDLALEKRGVSESFPPAVTVKPAP